MRPTELCERLARTPEDRLLLRRVLDRAVAAERKRIPCRTHFLAPREVALARQLVSALGQPSHRFEGGYPEAERRVCVFLPDWLEPGTAPRRIWGFPPSGSPGTRRRH